MTVVVITLFSPATYAAYVIYGTFILLLPYIFMCMHKTFKASHLNSFELYNLIVFILILSMLLSIFFNNRYFIYQDYTEILVAFRIIGIIYLSYSISNNKKKFEILIPQIFAIFGFYILLGYGEILNYYYDGWLSAFYNLYKPEHHLDASEILRQRGEGNRFSGLSGNPNSQGAILCLILIYLLLFFKNKNTHLLIIGACILLIILTQSRTSFFAMSAILITAFLQKKNKLSGIIIQYGLYVFLITITILMVSKLNMTFIQSIFNQNIIEQDTIQVRLENWNSLFKMFLEKPIFGHAPQQDFFQIHKINSDNEYVLQAWRYGLVGLFIYLFMMSYPILKLIRIYYITKKVKLIIIGLFVATIIISLTNVTISDFRFSLIYSLILGVIFGQINISKKIATNLARQNQKDQLMRI